MNFISLAMDFIRFINGVTLSGMVSVIVRCIIYQGMKGPGEVWKVNGLSVGDGGAFGKSQPKICTNPQWKHKGWVYNYQPHYCQYDVTCSLVI